MHGRHRKKAEHCIGGFTYARLTGCSGSEVGGGEAGKLQQKLRGRPSLQGFPDSPCHARSPRNVGILQAFKLKKVARSRPCQC